MTRFLAALGHLILPVLEDLGNVALLLISMFRHLFQRPFEFRLTVQETKRIGFESMGVVGLLGMFTGMVLVVQTGFTLKRIGSEMYVADMVALAMVRELGPVLAGFLVAGRVGSGIAAEIGAMATSEQIDAMRSLGANPIKKLVIPKTLASMLSLPLLTSMADLIGIIGGMFIGMAILNVPPNFFLNRVVTMLTVGDFASGVFKTAVFGAIIALVGCHFGFKTTGGTVGVGESATRSVVMSCVLILAADLLMTSLLFALGGIVQV